MPYSADSGVKAAEEPGFLAARFAGLGANYWALWGVALVAQAGAMVAPYLGLYLTGRFHYSIGHAGFVLGVVGLGGILSNLLGGVLVDWWGRRSSLMLGLFTHGLALALLGLTRGDLPILGVAFLVGVTGEIYRPASAALVAGMFDPDMRPRAYGLLYWAINLGFAISMLAGGFMARHGYELLFVANAAACLFCTAIALKFIPDESRQSTEGVQAGAMMAALKDSLFVKYLVSWMLYGIVVGQATTTLPLAMKREGYSASDYGAIMAVHAASIIILQPLIARQISKADQNRVLYAGMFIFGAGFALFGFAFDMPSYCAVVVIWTLGEVLVASVNQSIIASISTSELLGRYYGLYGVAYSTAFLIAPVVGTAVLSIGGPALWLACLALCTAASLAQAKISLAIRDRARSIVQVV